jgi:hypothetical protein
MKKLVAAFLAGAVIVAAVVAGNQKLADLALDEASYQANTCLLSKMGGEGFHIVQADKEAGTYSGVRFLVIFQLPFEVKARELNSRNDLRVIDCQTGE